MTEYANLYTAILVVVFSITVCSVTGFGVWLNNANSPLKRRLKELEEDRYLSGHIEGEEKHKGSFTVRWISPVGNLILPKEDWRKSRLRSRLVVAGYRGTNSLALFLSFKVMFAILVPVTIIFPVVMFSLLSPTKVVAVISLVCVAFVGFLFPDFVLYRKTKARRQHLSEVFPDAMDLLVVCVESGLSLDAAIQKVGQEVKHISIDMSNELRLVTLEMRAGKDRNSALKSLAARTGMPEILSLVSILVQSDHFGTSVATALREHSTEMREIRIQIAREKAAKLPVLITIPVAFFIFPALFLVVLGPAVIKIFVGYFGAMS